VLQTNAIAEEMRQDQATAAILNAFQGVRTTARERQTGVLAHIEWIEGLLQLPLWMCLLIEGNRGCNLTSAITKHRVTDTQDMGQASSGRQKHMCTMGGVKHLPHLCPTIFTFIQNLLVHSLLHHPVAKERSIRQEARKLRHADDGDEEAEEGGRAARAAPAAGGAAAGRAMIDLDSLAFSQGSHFMSKKACVLPPGSYRYVGFDEGRAAVEGYGCGWWPLGTGLRC
jgi:hypothetical protein